MTEREMLPCPFCGDDPSYEVMDRMIVVGCKPCGYQRAFPGLLQAEVSAVRVSEREFYHADATDKAVEGWNQRLALAQPVAAEPSIDDRKDAERYRWLREEAQYFSIGRAPAVVLCDEHDLLEKGKTPCEPDGWGFISGGRLDAAIDAARAARPTPA